MRDDRGDGERERRREHERHPEDAVREVRGVGIGDDDDADEPERDAERGGGGELLVGGDETRERGRHHGEVTQQNRGDTASDVPLAGEPSGGTAYPTVVDLSGNPVVTFYDSAAVCSRSDALAGDHPGLRFDSDQSLAASSQHVSRSAIRSMPR